MTGKLFLVALVCVSFAQGDRLTEVIDRGLRRAEGINNNGERRIEASLEEVSSKSDLLKSKTVNMLEKSRKTQEDVRQGLRSVAQVMEEKARESNAPASVFECIKRVEENANNEVESFTDKFEDDMQRLERTKLANIETDSKPLNGLGKALEVRYQRAVTQVKNCNNEMCVNTNVNSFDVYVNMMFAQISRILRQVTTIGKNFQRDSTTFLTNANRQINRVRSSATRNIRQCLYSRDFLSQEY